MATLADYRTRVATRIGTIDVEDATELALLDSWINEGVSEVMRRTRCKVAEADMTLTAGQYKYELDDDILAIVEMKLSSGESEYSFDATTDAEIYRMQRASQDSTTGARYYAVSGANLLLVYPTPAGNDTVTLLYVPRPATLSLPAHTPSEIPAEYHKGVELYALVEAADWDDDTSSAQGQRYSDRFDQWVVRTRKEINRKRGQRMGRVVIGRRPMSSNSTSRSADTGW